MISKNTNIINLILAILCTSLAILWLIAPNITLQLFGLNTEAETIIVAQRNGALFTALAILFWLKRNKEDFELYISMAIGCAILTFLSLNAALHNKNGGFFYIAAAIEAIISIYLANIIISRRNKERLEDYQN